MKSMKKDALKILSRKINNSLQLFSKHKFDRWFKWASGFCKGISVN